MVRLSGLTISLLVLVSGLLAGYLAGTRAIGEGAEAQERTVVRFYEALGALDQEGAQERLTRLLDPEFTDQRLDVVQTLDRAEFVRTAIQEARTFPQRKMVPVSTSSNRGWVVVLVKTVDEVPGRFGAIPLPAFERLQQESLLIQGEQIVGRVMLEGTGSILRSFEPTSLWSVDAGTKTVRIVRHNFDAYATERSTFPVDTLVVADLGRFSIGMAGSEQVLEAGDSMTIRAGEDVMVTNEFDAPARLLALFAVPIEQPSVDAGANKPRTVTPGVVISIVGQSQHFVSSDACVHVDYGFAIMRPGERLPLRRTSGHELIVPTSGMIDVQSQHNDLLRTDAARQWQDELPFATIGPGISVAIPPDSRATYTVSGQDPASFWVFTVEASSGCSSSA